MPSEITRLADRLTAVADAMKGERDLRRLPLGLLGFGHGSASAMVVAADTPELIRAIVTTDGRPDLAEIRLHRVVAPSLFLITRDDRDLQEMNRWAQHCVNCASRLELVIGLRSDIPADRDFDQLHKRACRGPAQFHLPGATEVSVDHCND